MKKTILYFQTLKNIFKKNKEINSMNKKNK